jgi:hypothetical protein
MCDQFQIQDGNVPLPSFHIREKAPVNSDLLGHLRLSPAVLSTQLPDSVSQANEQVFGHEPASWTVVNQLQTVFTQQS